MQEFDCSVNTNNFFHMEEIPLFLPETSSPLWLGIPGFSELPPSHHPSGELPASTTQHNTPAVTLNVREVMDYLQFDWTFFLWGEKAPFSKSLRCYGWDGYSSYSTGGKENTAACAACVRLLEIAIKHCKLLEFLWKPLPLAFPLSCS